MDADSINDIQHAIFAIREVLSGNDKYLDGDLLPPMSLSSKHDVIQRELRSIILSLDHLDHSYNPQTLDPGSRNLILHRYVAFRAKAAVTAVDCAYSHLRHHIFWNVLLPEMAAAAIVIAQDTMNSSEALLILLNERAESLPDRYLIGLPHMVDFYVMMHKLGFLLRDLSHTRNFVQSDVVSPTTESPDDTIASVMHPMAFENDHPNKTKNAIIGRYGSHRGAYRICRLKLGAPSPSLNAGSNSADIDQLADSLTPSVSPFTTPAERHKSQTSAYSLDLTYEFPPRPDFKARDDKSAQSQESIYPRTAKHRKGSRRNRRQRRHHRQVSSANTSDTLTMATDHVDPEGPARTARRNAITATSCLPSRRSELTNALPVRTSHRRNRTHTVRRDLPNPIYRAPYQDDWNVSKGYTIDSSAENELDDDRSSPDERETGLNTVNPNTDPKPQSTHTDIATTARTRRRAKRRLARRLNRRLKAWEREHTGQQELDKKLAGEANAVTTWQSSTGERAWGDVSGYGSMDG